LPAVELIDFGTENLYGMADFATGFMVNSDANVQVPWPLMPNAAKEPVSCPIKNCSALCCWFNKINFTQIRLNKSYGRN
jgi:hypothetical protein